MILDGRRFLIVGHRGAAGRAPENTAVSLAVGLAAGADQIEIDVGLTRDGCVVLLHDLTLDRTTSLKGALRARTWEDVRASDAGSWFNARFAGEPPIDLDDALAIVRPRVPLIVEVKATEPERERAPSAADRATVDGVLAAFARTGGHRGVTVSSAAWTLLAYAAGRAPGLDLALTVGWSEKRDPIAWAQKIGATAIHPNRRLCTPSYVARARGMGLLVIPYTVNLSAELAPLLDAGVDGVFTDDPSAMKRMLSRREAAPTARGTIAMGIDQGSGGTRAVLIDADGTIVAENAVRVAVRRDATGGIVQDAEAVAASVVRAAGPLAKAAARRIGCAGLAVQRSSLVVWKARDGRPVTPVLSWRSGSPAEIPEAVTAAEREIGEKTGLTARYPYGAIRLAALLARSPEIGEGLRRGQLVAGPLGSFLVARLGEDAPRTCDPSLAQRTLAYDITTGAFSAELAPLYGIDPSWWPHVGPSASERGRLQLGRSRIPLRALLGDVGAAARGVVGDVANAEEGVLVLGTGGFVVVSTGRTRRPVDGLLSTLLYEDADGPVYAAEGTVHGLAEALVEAGRRGGWEGLPVERIASRSGTAGRMPRVDAAIEGAGTPDWDPEPRFAVEPGSFTAEEVVAGTIVSLASRFARIAELLRAAGVAPARFVATGGLAFAPHVTAAISNAMAIPVTVDSRPNRTAAGAALLARDGR